jgi:3-hydroxybutyryl-CoA dehydrogenase
MSIFRVGVVGSRIMGAGVAEVAAASGFDVVVRSRGQEAADAVLAAVTTSLDLRSKSGGVPAPSSYPGSR